MTNPLIDKDAGLNVEIIVLRRLIKRVSIKANKELDPYKLSQFLEIIARTTVRLGHCLEVQSRISNSDLGTADFNSMIQRLVHDANDEMDARIAAGLPLFPPEEK